MNEYRHHVSGFFPNREEAESAMSRLVEGGLPRARLQLFDTSSTAPTKTPHAGSNEVLQDIVTDGAVGVAVGTALGGLAELALGWLPM